MHLHTHEEAQAAINALCLKNFNELCSLVDHCQTEEALFTVWREAHNVESNETAAKNTPKGQKKSAFVIDGILCKEVFQRSETKKVLFVLKESHDVNAEEGSDQRSFYTAYNGKQKDLRSQLRTRLVRIYNKIVQHEMEPEEVFQSIAYLNLNKRGGNRVCNGSLLHRYAYDYRVFIRRQIELINPELIICGGHVTFDALRRRVFCNKPIHSKTRDVIPMLKAGAHDYFMINNAVVMETKHPSHFRNGYMGEPGNQKHVEDFLQAYVEIQRCSKLYGELDSVD